MPELFEKYLSEIQAYVAPIAMERRKNVYFDLIFYKGVYQSECIFFSAAIRRKITFYDRDMHALKIIGVKSWSFEPYSSV